MFEPLKPNVTFGQEDPVYWQLHRFLHWEDARRAIPRRNRRTQSVEGNRSFNSRPHLTVEQRVADFVPKNRTKHVRSYYAKQFNLVRIEFLIKIMFIYLVISPHG